jgi:hypothetical protein
MGDRYNQADSLDHLGDTHRAAGNPEAARIAWQQATVILEDLSYPDAGSIRTKLHAAARAGITAGADPAEPRMVIPNDGPEPGAARWDQSLKDPRDGPRATRVPFLRTQVEDHFHCPFLCRPNTRLTGNLPLLAVGLTL